MPFDNLTDCRVNVVISDNGTINDRCILMKSLTGNNVIKFFILLCEIMQLPALLYIFV